MCNDHIDYAYSDVLKSMIPVYRQLLPSGIKMQLYSGDVDSVVPVTGTRQWIESLKLSVEKPWRRWKSSTGQVGGWTEDYSDGLSFVTVRDAGHMVPYSQPERALYVFSHWIHGLPL